MCCNDRTDLKVPKCQHDGMPSNLQCEMRPTECRPAILARSSTPKPDGTSLWPPSENVSSFKNRKPTQTWLKETQNSDDIEKRHDVNTLQRRYPSYIPIMAMLVATFLVVAVVVGSLRWCSGRHPKIGVVYGGVERIELHEVKGTGYDIYQVNPCAVTTTRDNTSSQCTYTIVFGDHMLLPGLAS